MRTDQAKTPKLRATAECELAKFTSGPGARVEALGFVKQLQRPIFAPGP